MENVETGYIDRKTDTYMIVFFRRDEDFSTEYRISKYKAQWIVKRREERK